MKTKYDIVVIGAGTAGTYYAKRMAEQGLSVLVVEKSKKEDLGKRLTVFHIDKELFSRFNVPEPKEGDEDYLTLFEYGYARSAYDKYEKRTDYPFLVMKLPLFLKRLTSWAESFGVEYSFDSEFSDYIYNEEGKISGAQISFGDKIKKISARLVVDASGIGAYGRTKLPDSYGVENFVVSPSEMFYVVLRYVILDNPKEDAVHTSIGYPFYKTWIAPSVREDGAILGVGANLSFEYAEKMFGEFSKDIKLPSYKIEHYEKGVTPYRRPPYSFVADGFLALGDAACITKPYSGEGITAAWVLCDIAAEETYKAMQNGAYPTKESMWNINCRYNRTQGADFAKIMATLIGAVDCTREENDYEFKKGIVFNNKAMTDMNRNFANKMSLGETLALVIKVLGGVISGNIRLSTVKNLLKSVLKAGEIKKHYKAFPSSIADYKAWEEKANKLWQKAGSMADNIKNI